MRCPVGVFRVWPSGQRELWAPWAHVDVHAAGELERAEQLRRLEATTACLRELWENDPGEPRTHAGWEAKRGPTSRRRDDRGNVSPMGLGVVALAAVGIAVVARKAARRS